MKKNEDFYKQRNIDNSYRLAEIRNNELPFFCNEFFLGIESNTSSLTRLNYAYDLKLFFYFLTTKIDIFKNTDIVDFTINQLKHVTLLHLEMFSEFLSCYKQNNKTITNGNKGKARKLSSVRAMFKYFYNKDYLSQNVSAKLQMPKIHEKEIVRLEKNEVENLLNVAEYGEGMSAHQEFYHEKTRIRDTAILTLFLGTGIRISECVGLNISDVDFSTKAFTVTRKGGNRVILYFSEEVADALKKYLSQREFDDSIPKEERALFLSLQNKRISIRAVQNLVKKYSQISTPLKNISPHKLRSTYGTALYRETGDIYVVAEVLGHRDVNTTKKHYAAMSEDIRKTAANEVVLRKDKN